MNEWILFITKRIKQLPICSKPTFRFRKVVQQKTNSRGGQLLYNILFLRMFSSDLIHMFCAGLSGLFVWGFKNKKIYVMPLVYAIFIHGIFNFFNYFNGGIQFFSYVAILFAVIECRVKYVKFAAEAEDSKTLTDATEISAKTKKSTKENSAKKTKKTQSKVNEKLKLPSVFGR